MQREKKMPLSALVLAEMIIDSQLLPEANVRSLLAACEATSAGSSAAAFAEFLTSRGVLTRWQTGKLCTGKWKGFIVDHYRLDDHLSTSESYSRYAATDVRSQRRIVLAIRRGPPPPRYTVDEQAPDG